MMIKSSKTLHARLIRHLREWHRKLGIIAAFFLIFLSLSGIALNHTDWLKLGHQNVTNSWLLDHYGIKAPDKLQFFHQNAFIVTDSLVWLNDQLLLETSESIIAAGQFQQFILVISADHLFLYNLQGELVDQLGAISGLPEHISAVNIGPDNLIINTDSGYYQTDSGFLDWQAVSTTAEPNWITQSSPSIEDKQLAISHYKSQFLTWERIILDTHSGRFFGLLGVLFMDAVGLLLILLSVSGIYIWIRYARSKR